MFTQCMRRFPDAMRGIPQPQYHTDASASYSYQATSPPPPTLQSWSQPSAPPPPTPQSWSQPSAPPPPTLQLWSTPAAAPTPSTNTIPATTYFHPRLHAKTCTFCRADGHHVCMCALANKYIQSGRATYVNDCIHLLNEQPVPFDGT